MLDKQTIIDEIKSINNFVSQEDFVKAFKNALSLILKREKAINNEFIKLKNELLSLFDGRSKEIKDGKDGKDGIDGRDGKDADEIKILEMLEKKIPTIEEWQANIPANGKAIRDSLELLQGDERLEMSAIKDLKELLEEIKSTKSQKLGGG